MSKDRSAQRRHWFQFRLRTLLLAVLVLSLPLSWFGMRTKEARRQREAVEALAEFGQILYQCQDTFPLPRQKPYGPMWLRRLLGDDFFNDITYVDISDPKVDDSTLIHLKAFPKLRCLRLNETLVTDTGLKQLKQLGLLEELYLSDQTTGDGLRQLAALDITHLSIPPHFTDDDLKSVSYFPSLEVLYLDESNVTDLGLEHLRGLRNLQYLSLGETGVTDAGMKHLKSLPNLQVLWVPWTRVTDAARECLPNVQVYTEDDLATSYSWEPVGARSGSGPARSRSTPDS